MGQEACGKRVMCWCLSISSFGQSGIFLIGGKTKQVKPVPILLRSGDIVIMSEESRLAYHGVPKILAPSDDEPVPRALSSEMLQQSSTCPYCRGGESLVVDDKKKDSALCRGHSLEDPAEMKLCQRTSCCVEAVSSWDDFESYLSVSRINLNVRQVNPA